MTNAMLSTCGGLFLIAFFQELKKHRMAVDCRANDPCKSAECLDDWWSFIKEKPGLIALGAVMVFLATFLPKIIVRLLIFSLAKIKYIRLLVLSAASLMLLGS